MSKMVFESHIEPETCCAQPVSNVSGMKPLLPHDGRNGKNENNVVYAQALSKNPECGKRLNIFLNDVCA